METREPLTIRFPPALLKEAREVKAQRESLNDLVVRAVEQEVRRRRGLQAYDTILRVRATVKAETGLHPDSTASVRSLRDGSERRA